jgi:hypothetical protein
LERFKSYEDPVKELDAFLQEIQAEAERRGYAFDRTKLGSVEGASKMPVTSGQLKYELEHLKGKLLKRDPLRYQALAGLILPDPNPVFEVVNGDLEPWERVHPK